MNNESAIIIVNWNGLKFLKNCLSSVFNQTYDKFDVYFIDNGSKDKSVAFVENNFSLTKIIKLKKNTGFTGGNNIGIKKALENPNINYIVLLNNDTIVNKNWLEELIKAANKKQEIGMVSSKSLFPNGKIQTIGISLEKNIVGTQDGGISIGYNQEGNKFNGELEILAPSGVSALYKRKFIEEVGVFDDDFFAYSEDLDLGLRGRLLGWQCIYTPHSKLIHFHSQTAGLASPFKTYMLEKNIFFTVIKNFPLTELLLFPFRNIKTKTTYFFKKNKLNSCQTLKTSIGFCGMAKILFKVYLQVLALSPKMLKKRRQIQKNKKISRQAVKDLFNRFNRKNIENNLI